VLKHSLLEEDLPRSRDANGRCCYSTVTWRISRNHHLAGRGEQFCWTGEPCIVDRRWTLSGALFKTIRARDAFAAESAWPHMRKLQLSLQRTGFFSMDGDVGPLDSLARSSRAHDAWLVVDDAHGLVYWAKASGAVEYFRSGYGCRASVGRHVREAFGSFGAFVAGSGELIEPSDAKSAIIYIHNSASRSRLRQLRERHWRLRSANPGVANGCGAHARFRAGAQQLGCRC